MIFTLIIAPLIVLIPHQFHTILYRDFPIYDRYRFELSDFYLFDLFHPMVASLSEIAVEMPVPQPPVLDDVVESME